MRPFLHDRLRRYEELLSSSNDALRAYTALDVGLDEVVLTFLDEAGAVYRAVGSAEAQNETLAFKAEFTSARGGVHPLTLERVTRRRREMERSIALRVLVTAAERLRGECAGVRGTLDEARERLLPIVAYGLRKGLIPAGRGAPGRAEPEPYPEPEHMWRAVLADPESGPAARQLALGLNEADVHLLLADLLASTSR